MICCQNDRDAGHGEAVLERREEEHADRRAAHPADPAREARAAEQDRGGRVEEDRLADLRARGADAGGLEHAAEAQRAARRSRRRR